MDMASIVSKATVKNGRVVLLGATGRLGNMLRSFWPKRGDLILHSTKQRLGFECFDLLQGTDALARLSEGARMVICLPGVTPAAARATGASLTQNTDLALAALEGAAAAGAGRVLLASSAAVYGAGGEAHRETCPCFPISDYGQAKYVMEGKAAATAKQLDQPLTIARIGNVAGADAILGDWHHGISIDKLADGRTPRRSYVGPATLANLIYQLSLRADLPDILNIAAPGTVEMGALLDAASLPWTPRAAGPGVIAKVELCTERLETYISFAPESKTAAGMVREWQRLKAVQ